MRKSLVILMVLSILSCGGIAWANVTMGDEIDNVQFSEKLIYGDKSAVEGVTIAREARYDTNLFWNTTYTIGETNAIETDFSFYEFGKKWEYNGDTKGAGLSFQNSHTQVHMFDEMHYKEDSSIGGLNQALAELMESAPAGQVTTKLVKLKDYQPYYTFELYVDIEGLDYDYGNYDMYAGYSDEIIMKKKTTLEEFHNFFKIPVLEEERYLVGVNKDVYGSVVGYGLASHHTASSVNDYDAEMGLIGGDSFFFDMSSVYTEDTLYFTFCPLTFEGKLIDTSLIPGGYGIYSCKYDVENKLIDAATLKLEYSLEPTGYVSLELDAQEENLLVFTEDSKHFYMTVLDFPTFEAKQTIIYSDVKSSSDVARYQRVEEDYLIVQGDYYEAMVLSRNEDGTYTQEFVMPAFLEEVSNENYFLESDNAFAWNGKTLIVAGDMMVEEPYYMSGCGVFLAAFDETGLIYYAEYDSSLNTGAVEEEYWICEPVDLEIGWKE